MKKFLMYGVVGAVLPFLASCGDDEDKTYTGENQVYLSAENPVIEESEATPLVVNVDLTSSYGQDITLDFKVTDDSHEILKLVDNPVTIPAGSRTATFQVVSNQKNILEEDTYFSIGLASVSVDDIKLNDVLKVRVTPGLKVPELSESQKELIEGYKVKYGIDLNEWIGVVPCTTKVESPAGGSTDDFAAEFERTLSGKTVITLSEQATEEVPVLKMTVNPMGLTEYFAWVMRQETVENDEYWFDENSGPSYKQIMDLLQWNRENPGSFTMSLDGLTLKEVSNSAASVDFVKTDEEKGYDIIPFDYVFSPWEYQKELIEQGNQVAIDLEETDGTANPSYYLQYGSVSEDEFGDGNFIEPEGKLDFSAQKMTFQFVFSHNMGSGYTRIYVTYEK